MFCPNCGRENIEKKNYCPSCGIALGTFKESLSKEHDSKAEHHYFHYIVMFLGIGALWLVSESEKRAIDYGIVGIMVLIALLIGYQWFYETKRKQAWLSTSQTTKLPEPITNDLPAIESSGSVTEHTTRNLELEPARNKQGVQNLHIGNNDNRY